MIDLHTHSSRSDGTFSPSELVITAKKIGLRAVALTDHDTVSGLAEAIESARKLDLDFVPGVEISTKLDTGSLHIVGLYVDHNNKELQKDLDYLAEARKKRSVLIADKLIALNAPINIKDIERLAAGATIGRPHIAAALVMNGHVKDVKSAFTKYLARNKPAYVPKEKLSKERAIEVILKAGGVPVLAHPDQTKKRGKNLESLVCELKELGLLGIEAYCSGYSSYDIGEYTNLGKRYGLAISGGSDFHGALKPGIELGFGPGNLKVPDELLEKIRKVRSV